MYEADLSYLKLQGIIFTYKYNLVFVQHIISYTYVGCNVVFIKTYI
jgi:hypothetical protein